MIADLRPDHNGYMHIAVTPSMLARAKTRAEVGDSVGGTRRSMPTERWHGHLGESCAKLVYAAHGIDVVWDGGCNGEPDFRIGSISGDVKTSSIHRGPFRPSYWIGIVADALEERRQPDGLFCCVYDDGADRLSVIGTIATRTFCEHARRIKVGELMPNGYAAMADGLFIPAELLTPIARHLAKLRGDRAVV